MDSPSFYRAGLERAIPVENEQMFTAPVVNLELPVLGIPLENSPTVFGKPSSPAVQAFRWYEASHEIVARWTNGGHDSCDARIDPNFRFAHRDSSATESSPWHALGQSQT
jgi:hypothetical protein